MNPEFGRLEIFCFGCHDGKLANFVSKKHGYLEAKSVIAKAKTQGWKLPHLDDWDTPSIGRPCTLCHVIHSKLDDKLQLHRPEIRELMNKIPISYSNRRLLS